jgi:mRNA-degrading endonuclease toxin of MazEF toxin-antitoxin module
MFCTIENAPILLSGHFFLKIKTNSRIMCYLNFIYEGVFIMCKITHGSIVLVDVPHNPESPHQHSGRHFYLLCSNEFACRFSPVLQVLPFSSRSRRLPVQPEVEAECFTKQSFALAEQLTLLPRHILESGKNCGTLTPASMKKVKEAIKIQLALD